jgi:phospholipid/cholesterol/gamma-HCH transport system permease protein
MTRTDERLAAAAGGLGAAVLDWLRGWWHIAHLGALLMALALSPSSYRAARRPELLRQVYLGTAPGLPWFMVMSSLAGLVLIRIVTVTAVSYGLTQYALEMVVRVLVLELIPLSAALYVALRYTLPQRAVVATLARHRRVDLQGELLPRVLSGIFAVLMLAAVSCVAALVIAYLSIHGLTPWAFPSYTHTVGKIFNPAVTLIFALKTAGFSLTVALIPVASAIHDVPHPRLPSSGELRALVRMFALLLLIEAASLMGNYY